MTTRLARRALATRLLFGVAIAGFAACGTSGGGSTGPGGDNVIVVATAGTTPHYNWNGPLAISINVVRTSAPSVAVWGITSPINRDIAPGSQQGIVPPGATETATAERTLTVGVRYRVTVALTDGTSGSVDFTP